MSLLDNSKRIRDYSSIYNFRDFGAYTGFEGRALRQNLLFRSAHLNKLNDADHADISKQNIGLIVDLRHAPERARQPSRLPSNGPQVIAYPDPPESAGEKVAPHEAFLQHELHSAQDAHGYMMRSYLARPDNPAFQSIFRDTLEFLTEQDNEPLNENPAPILVHCAAGKDRTGTLCALIQGLLGVSRENILRDYMLTLEAVDIEEIIVPAAKMFSERYGREINPEALWPMFGVAPEFLDASLETMGDIETYAKTKLGLSQAGLDAIRARYLEQ